MCFVAVTFKSVASASPQDLSKIMVHGARQGTHLAPNHGDFTAKSHDVPGTVLLVGGQQILPHNGAVWLACAYWEMEHLLFAQCFNVTNRSAKVVNGCRVRLFSSSILSFNIEKTSQSTFKSHLNFCLNIVFQLAQLQQLDHRQLAFELWTSYWSCFRSTSWTEILRPNFFCSNFWSFHPPIFFGLKRMCFQHVYFEVLLLALEIWVQSKAISKELKKNIKKMVPFANPALQIWLLGPSLNTFQGFQFVFLQVLVGREQLTKTSGNAKKNNWSCLTCYLQVVHVIFKKKWPNHGHNMRVTELLWNQVQVTHSSRSCKAPSRESWSEKQPQKYQRNIEQPFLVNKQLSAIKFWHGSIHMGLYC